MSDPTQDKPEKFGPLFRKWGIRVHPDQALQLDLFLGELELWNKKINLTGLSSRQRIVDELLVDSLLPTPFLPAQGTLLDVGSGAGFPAIPIKICKPRLRCQLIEPNAKKTHFLKQVIRLVRLEDIEVIQGRMEEQEAALLPTGYDVITSRAFVPLDKFLTLCAPHLSRGGSMVAFLGSQSELTIQQSAKIIDLHGLFPFKRIPYALPDHKTQREILILKKQG